MLRRLRSDRPPYSCTVGCTLSSVCAGPSTVYVHSARLYEPGRRYTIVEGRPYTDTALRTRSSSYEQRRNIASATPLLRVRYCLCVRLCWRWRFHNQPAALRRPAGYMYEYTF
jgi:hypothetical protein